MKFIQIVAVVLVVGVIEANSDEYLPPDGCTCKSVEHHPTMGTTEPRCTESRTKSYNSMKIDVQYFCFVSDEDRCSAKKKSNHVPGAYYVFCTSATNQVAENGEQACEGHEYDEDKCSHIGCCYWENGECFSAVGKDSCFDEAENGEQACEGHEYDEDKCSHIGCCYWENGECFSAVGKDSCFDEAPAGTDSGYSDWGLCSLSCGGGIQVRSCTNPDPENGGADCTSLGADEQYCNTDDCPDKKCVGVWSDCSNVTCKQTYKITTEATGKGATCEFKNGNTQVCKDASNCKKKCTDDDAAFRKYNNMEDIDVGEFSLSGRPSGPATCEWAANEAQKIIWISDMCVVGSQSDPDWDISTKICCASCAKKGRRRIFLGKKTIQKI